MNAEPVKAFADTNVLVYFTTAENWKADRTEEILVASGFVSVQVLNELANVLRRKMRFSWEQVHQALAVVRNMMTVVPVTLAIHERGLDLAERHGFQLYDAMIVAAALDSGCDVLWSEDMHDGLVVDGRLTIRNPFADG